MSLSWARSARVASALLIVVAASLSAPGSSLAQGVSIEQATDAQKKEAQTQYDRGAKAFDAKQFEEAHIAFSASYGVVKSPNAHMMMARALMQLGRHAKAHNELLVVEQEATGLPKYAQTLERAKDLRNECLPKVGLVTVFLKGDKTGPVKLTVNDQVVAPERAFAVDPGKVKIVVESAGVPTTKEISVLAGQSELVELRLGPDADPLKGVPPPVVSASATTAPVAPPPVEAPTERSPAATGLIVSGVVVGLLGLGTMAVGSGFYFSAQDQHNYLSDPEQSGCLPNGGDGFTCPATAQQKIDDGRDSQDVAAIVFGVGGGVTALGLGLVIAGGILAGPPVNDDRVSVRVGPTSASMTVAF